jgi:hypothetical protein
MEIRRTSARLAILLSAAFFGQGCATVWNLSRGELAQKIPVTSSPIGARVLVDGKDKGVAPLTLKLAPSRVRTVRIELDGYDPVEIQLARESHFWSSYVPNILLGAVIVGLVDPSVIDDDDEFSLLAWALVLPTALALSGVDYLSGSLSFYAQESLDVPLVPVQGEPHARVVLVTEHRWRAVKWLRVRAASGL